MPLITLALTDCHLLLQTVCKELFVNLWTAGAIGLVKRSKIFPGKIKRQFCMWKGKTRFTSCNLEFKSKSSEFKSTSCEFNSTSCEFNSRVTKSKARVK